MCAFEQSEKGMNFFMIVSMYKYLKKSWLKLYSNLNIAVKRIMVNGIKFSFIICLFSTLLLSIYISTNHSYVLYDLGISLFKSSTTFMVVFFIYGIVFNKLIKEKID